MLSIVTCKLSVVSSSGNSATWWFDRNYEITYKRKYVPPYVFVTWYSSRVFVFILTDPCIPADVRVTSYNMTSVTLSWVVPEDQNNTLFSFVSLFSSANKIQNYTTTNKELTFTGLSPGTTYSVSISSLCNGTESIPSTNDVQTGNCKNSTRHWCWWLFWWHRHTG